MAKIGIFILIIVLPMEVFLKGTENVTKWGFIFDCDLYGFWTTFIFHLSVYQGETPGDTDRRHQSPKAPVMNRRTPKGAQVNVRN